MTSNYFKQFCKSENLDLESLNALLVIIFSFIIVADGRNLNDFHFEIDNELGKFEILDKVSSESFIKIIKRRELILFSKVALVVLLRIHKNKKEEIEELQSNLNKGKVELFSFLDFLRQNSSLSENEIINEIETKLTNLDPEKEAINALYDRIEIDDFEYSEFYDNSKDDSMSWFIEDGPYCPACQERPCMCSDPDPG